jgi:transcriptional regulator with XRE-family HTH domain
LDAGVGASPLSTVIKFPDDSPARGANALDGVVGRRLRERREALRLNQSELGRRVGVTFQQIQKYERGTNRIGASRLFQLAQTLSVPLSYFFDGVVLFQEMPSPAAKNKGRAVARDEATQILLQAFQSISDRRSRQAVIQLVRSLAEEERARSTK